MIITKTAIIIGLALLLILMIPMRWVVSIRIYSRIFAEEFDKALIPKTNWPYYYLRDFPRQVWKINQEIKRSQKSSK